jgi:hypothetical protein
VLLADFATPIEIMKQISDEDEELGVLAFRTWPLFRGFRKLPIFGTAFEEVFREPSMR